MAGEILATSEIQLILSVDHQLKEADRTYRGKFKELPVAVKIVVFNGELENQLNREHWEKLITLQNDHLVRYLSFQSVDNRHLLVMDMCCGSMVDYCNGTLDIGTDELISPLEIMWQMTSGLDFLHQHDIVHGALSPNKVLFWKKNSKSRLVFIKLNGYGFYNSSTTKDCYRKDVKALGWLYYSVASKQIDKPNRCMGRKLIGLDENFRDLGAALINQLITENNPRIFQVAILLKYPLFIRYCEDARSRLRWDFQSDPLILKRMKENLYEWLQTKENYCHIDNEDVNDLKDILLSEEYEERIPYQVDKLLKICPQIFTDYLWHIVSKESDPSIQDTQERPREPDIESTGILLGEGSYGKVYSNVYTDKDGKKFQAAFKGCRSSTGAELVFDREINTLKKLDHLFVIKFIDVIEKHSKKWMVLELCEGTLKQYMKDELERIPKETLDEKILIGQICLGMAYLHQHNIIHKDLKPDNVLLWCSPIHPCVVLAKLADFGFAKELKPNQLEFSNTKHPGTKRYMAPELLKAKDGEWPASFPSDLYSLGVVIGWIALKGVHPYDDDNRYVTDLYMTQGIPPPNVTNLSWDLRDLIIRLTKREPEKRPRMSHILCHPYFLLPNNKTQKIFVEQFLIFLRSLPEESDGSGRSALEKKILNNDNVQEWFKSLGETTAEDSEDIHKMEKALKRVFKKKCSYTPMKEYEKITKQTFVDEYRDFESTFFQMSNIDDVHDFLQVIQLAPKPFSLYLWSQLTEYDEKEGYSQQNQCKKSRGKRGTRDQPSVLVAEKRNQNQWEFQFSQLGWSFLILNGDQKMIDELWRIKYQVDQSEIYIDNDRHILRESLLTAVHWNVSEQMWLKLLDRVGDVICVFNMLEISVSSFSFNSHRITKILLEKLKSPSSESSLKAPIYSNYGLNLLCRAAANEDKNAIKIVKLLLKSGENCNTPDHKGLYPLHYAVKNISDSALDITKLLLHAGASVKVPIHRPILKGGGSILFFAVTSKGQFATEIVEELLKRGAKCDEIDETSQLELIHWASLLCKGADTIRILDLLIEKRGVDVIGGDQKRKPLNFAIFNQGNYRLEIIKKLLDKEADPNSVDAQLFTPLHLVFLTRSWNECDAFDIVSILLKYGANPNAVNKDGQTPLYYAVLAENSQHIVKLLLEKGGDPTVQDKNRISPILAALHNTSSSGQQIRNLLPISKRNVNIPLSDEFEETLLHRIAAATKYSDRDYEILNIVLQNEGDPNASNKLGHSPMFVAACNNSIEGTIVLEKLLRMGGNPNIQSSKEKNSPIHVVVGSSAKHANQKRDIQYLMTLLDNGGNPNIQNAEKATPVHLATMNSNTYAPDLLKMLLDKGGNPNAVDKNQMCPLHWAIQNPNRKERLEIIQILLGKGANPNAKDTNGRTPLHYVLAQEQKTCFETLKLLIKEGASILVSSDMGTPLNLVMGQGRKQSYPSKIRRFITKISTDNCTPSPMNHKLLGFLIFAILALFFIVIYTCY